MRRGAGVFSRADFNPIMLSTAQWAFTTTEFRDFINKLWNCDKNAKGAEYFTEHAWLSSKKKTILKAEVKARLAPILFKINTPKSIFTRRKWVSGFCRIEASGLIVSGDEAGSKGPGEYAQPFGVNLKSLELATTITRYTYTFALQNRETKVILFWLRFKTLENYDEFKLAINEYTDPAIVEDLHMEVSARYRDSLIKSVQARDYLRRGSAGLSGVSGPGDRFPGLKPAPKEPRDQELGEEKVSILREADEKDDERNTSYVNPLRSLMWDQHQKTVEAVDAAAQRVMYSLQCQGIIYRRSTQIRCGWSYGKGGSLAPYPSQQRCAIHPGKKWDGRAEEFLRVIKTGKPLSSPILYGDQWFVIDASWFRHWKTFISSSRRMVPPGPIDNLWMVSSSTSCVIEGLREDTEEVDGDYRCVTPEIWNLFEELYGGGPPISFVGPPANDVSRWLVHFAGLSNDGVNEQDAFMEEYSDHESDVNSEEGVLHIDLPEGQKASLDELIKIAELFGFEDYFEDPEGDADIRMINVEEGVGELYDYLEHPEDIVDNIERKKKILAKRASMEKRKKRIGSGEKKIQSEEDKLKALPHLVHRDFDEEESDSENSVDSWSEEIVALTNGASATIHTSSITSDSNSRIDI